MVSPLRLGFDVEDRDGNLVARDGTCDADWARELVQRANVLGVPFKVEVARGAGGVLVVGGGLWSGGGDQLRVEAAATAKLAIRVRCAKRACGVSNRITWSGSAIAAIGMEG